jgi:protein-S-isoprenylcysteine O-methyltransferase Ste14
MLQRRAVGILAVMRHLLAIVVLPGSATVLVPLLLLDDAELAPWPLVALGAVLLAVGAGLFAWTVALFAGIGRGTLAPWDPPERLVVRGPYRHVRNPMISAVLFVLLGESALFGSFALLAWAAVFLAVNATYFPLVEEPGLQRRFGAEYAEYAAHVPRWLPRPRPWEPS